MIKMVSDEFKQKIDATTEFIESCWDENNPDDGLTFDERVQERMEELPEDIQKIVKESLENKDEPKTVIIDEHTEEKECECDCEIDCSTDGNYMPPKTLLKLTSETKQLAKDKKRDLKIEQARLRLETDWSKHFDKKPTEKEKEAWILLETMDLVEEVDDLKCEADYMGELWDLEKIMLRKK